MCITSYTGSHSGTVQEWVDQDQKRSRKSSFGPCPFTTTTKDHQDQQASKHTHTPSLCIPLHPALHTTILLLAILLKLLPLPLHPLPLRITLTLLTLIILIVVVVVIYRTPGVSFSLFYCLRILSLYSRSIS